MQTESKHEVNLENRGSSNFLRRLYKRFTDLLLTMLVMIPPLAWLQPTRTAGRNERSGCNRTSKHLRNAAPEGHHLVPSRRQAFAVSLSSNHEPVAYPNEKQEVSHTQSTQAARKMFVYSQATMSN
jgi:hypothetical protein